MRNLFQYIIDYIFPPSDEEFELRSLAIDWLISNAPSATKAEFPFIRSLFSYKYPLVKELIWQIKYRKNKHAIKCAGYSLYCELNKTTEFITLLLPIPISNKRRKERGYNQCELIIDEIIKLDINKKFTKNYSILIREKDIEKQTHKNREQRIINTKHIFKVTSIENLNQKIIIIDDVTTTGSTLKEARDELLKAGYENVTALTIAH